MKTLHLTASDEDLDFLMLVIHRTLIDSFSWHMTLEERGPEKADNTIDS